MITNTNYTQEELEVIKTAFILLYNTISDKSGNFTCTTQFEDKKTGKSENMKVDISFFNPQNN